MRVTHIITRLVIGGAQENTVSTVLGLREKPDVQVDLISGPTVGPEGSMESALEGRPRLIRVPSLVRPVHPWKDVRALTTLTSILRDLRSDLVHTHSGKAGILGRLAARRAGIPVIIHHIHGPSFGPFPSVPANAVFLAAERYAGRATTHFLCSAQAMARRYLAAGIGRPEMYTRVFSGFRVEPFIQAKNDPGLRRKLGLPPDAFVIGKIGRLVPLKGHADLLAAARDFVKVRPNARLLFVGEGSLRSELEAIAQSYGLRDKIIFTGLLPPSEVAAYVGIMDCLVHLSYREAVSRALPQALAAGKPVIAYDFDGADEVCIPNETGFLVRTGDIVSVTARLADLANDPGLRQRFGARGRDLVAKEFRVEDMIEKIYALYLRLLGPSAGEHLTF
jgi:glycosyltransferase involved in cell wall biosynthesis